MDDQEHQASHQFLKFLRLAKETENFKRCIIETAKSLTRLQSALKSKLGANKARMMAMEEILLNEVDGQFNFESKRKVRNNKLLVRLNVSKAYMPIFARAIMNIHVLLSKISLLNTLLLKAQSQGDQKETANL